jgi:hypothetical protein
LTSTISGTPSVAVAFNKEAVPVASTTGRSRADADRVYFILLFGSEMFGFPGLGFTAYCYQADRKPCSTGFSHLHEELYAGVRELMVPRGHHEI